MEVEYTDTFISPEVLDIDIKFTANNITYKDIIVVFEDADN